ncbi:hypothetical protein A1Q1_00807 [Trichosporon asahii var. asahii CBS 2479]|uniref:Uncharacterized protein n=1 Tax=Trichosporon asahii var. asahii (strain ATCC 90039 / CBS 2479 / JCM 2466 / KCTC 7840 / NBRC 103889/ NCYC 2677 / UAMH 7654) TaxID=1186058 RepID=J6FCW5_TRIAS|nr:hypothetical protein A1Q1_00807 [Trichosporon asahii var. asahii CBS 2479]EJT52902.1 hypothetical protein A1Q1_00807 [Trichosporon asahii var. asahii CBS 2479]
MASNPLLPPLKGVSASSFYIPSANEAHTFHPHETVQTAMRVTIESAGVGLLVSAVQNALDKHNRGAMGIFTRTGGTIGLFVLRRQHPSGAITGRGSSTNSQTDDWANGAAGGCAAGFTAGVKARSLPMAIGACAGMATLIGTFEAAGSNLTGDNRQNLPREEREQRRLHFFKKPQTEEASS